MDQKGPGLTKRSRTRLSTKIREKTKLWQLYGKNKIFNKQETKEK